MSSTSTQTVGLLFPGQGAQYVGMGKALYEANTTARAILDEAQSVLGGEFLKTLFEGPMENLTATDVSQPGIYAVSYAAYRAWRERNAGARIGAAAGLSLGEYTALTAAGCLPFSAGIELVRQRGRLMQEAAASRSGAMASILSLDAEKVAEICGGLDGAHVANYNCPGQIVISGEKTAVERAGVLCSQAGARKVIPLQVSGAFHSPLMAAAQQKLLPLLEAVPWREPEFPVLSNVTGLPHQAGAGYADAMSRQVVESVRWEDDCRWMLVNGIEVFYEIGPGKVLQGLMKKIEPLASVTSGEVF
jgi:[acyl-carrier-protein] S-malonyltransferase